MPRILVADEGEQSCVALGPLLVAEGYEVAHAHDGDSTLIIALAQSFDAIVLDIKLCSSDSLEVIRKLREQRPTPILLLTASDDEQGMIMGLEKGADGCLAKPFNPLFLLAYIRAMLRRGRLGAEEHLGQTLTVGDLVLQTGSKVVRCGDIAVSLSGTEFSLLEMLIRNAGCIVSRERLLGHIFGLAHGGPDRRIDAHISRIRKKLGPFSQAGIRIRASRKAGYVLAI